MTETNGADPGLIELLIREGLVSAAQVARSFPPGRSGKKRHPNSITRRIVRGIRGVKLEGFRGMDGTWYTSWPAVARHFARLTPGAIPAPAAQPDHARAAAAAAELLAMRRKK